MAGRPGPTGAGAPSVAERPWRAVAGGLEIRVRVTPRGGRDALTLDDAGAIHVRVTAPPEDGKANAAVRKLLARALGIAPSRLTLVGGATSRDKLFRID